MGKVIMSGLVGEMTVPVKPLMLGDVAEGQIITIKENNNPVEFYVAKHNYEEGLNGKGRTLVVRKEAHSNQKYSILTTNDFLNSEILKWLNDNYKALFSTNMQNCISNTKFKNYVNGFNLEIRTLEKSFFLLSSQELGASSDGQDPEGSKLPIADKLLIATMNRNAVTQWTRTPSPANDEKVICFNKEGIKVSYNSSNYSFGVRPIFTLPATSRLNPDRSVIE